MTTVYFIRHAQSDPSHRDDRTRPLTEAGLRDTKLITACLGSRGISHILSSPYQRTLDTVAHLAETLALPVETDEDFRERDAGGWHGDCFLDFVRAQWEDFEYRTPDGESLAMVQKRNVAALERVMRKYHGQHRHHACIDPGDHGKNDQPLPRDLQPAEQSADLFHPSHSFPSGSKPGYTRLFYHDRRGIATDPSPAKEASL